MDKLTIKTNNIALKFNTGSIVVTGGNVESVNGKTGPSIILDATDVSAEPAGAVQQAKDEIQPQINELNNEVDLIQPQLVNLSENKLDKVDYVQHFLGVFPSKAALDAAHPTARPGDSADIDSGSGFDVMRAIWDESDQKWVIREVNNAQNTDQVPEGNTNLYFKTERVLVTLLSGFNPVNAVVATTDTIIQALSKLQGQISNTQNVVRGTILTGLTTAIGGQISSTDTLLQALGKLQNQLTVQAIPTWFDFATFGTVSPNLTNVDIQLARWAGMLWIRGSFQVSTSINQYAPILTLTGQQYKVWANRGSSPATPRVNGMLNIWTDSGILKQLQFISDGVVTNNIQAGLYNQHFDVQTGIGLLASDGYFIIPPTPLGKLVN